MESLEQILGILIFNKGLLLKEVSKSSDQIFILILLLLFPLLYHFLQIAYPLGGQDHFL